VSDFPQGWAESTLGFLAGPSQYGWTTSARQDGNGLKLLRTTDISRGTLDWDSVPFCAEEPADSGPYKLASGDVVISRAGSVGLSYRLTEIVPAVFASYLIRFRPSSEIDGRYLGYFLRSRAYWAQIAAATAGITLANVNAKKLSAVKIPVAPRREQGRIVAAIEEQFSRLDAGASACERARQNLRHLQTAVLRDAWNWALTEAGGLSSVAELLDSPLANGRSVPDAPTGGFPVLRLTCVRDGVIDVSQAKLGAWTAEQAHPYLVREGDFLVVRGNGSKHLVGRGGLVRRDAAVAYPDTLIRIRPKVERVAPAFLRLVWDTPSVRRQIEQAARTTAGIYKINQVSLARIELPVPPLVAQQRIVDWSTRHLSQIGLLDTKLARALRRANNLRSSVLVAAFAGNLAAQDPCEEPASVLLERIATETTFPNGHWSSRGGKGRREVSV
jgi:type I restriction enzyme, S subunit